MQYGTPSRSEQARALETFRPFDNPETCSPPPVPRPELPYLADRNSEELLAEYDTPNDFSFSKVALSFEPQRRAVGIRNPVEGARGPPSSFSQMPLPPQPRSLVGSKAVGFRDVQSQSAIVPPGSQSQNLKALVDELPPFPFTHTPTIDSRREATRSVTYEDLVSRGKAEQTFLRGRKSLARF